MNVISPLLRSLHYADASRWSDGQRISPLLRELIDANANARARRPEIAQALRAAGMPFEGRPLFGVAPVEAAADGCYQPAEAGHWCLITPAFQDGALVDLVATHCRSLNSRTRRGVADVLGADWLRAARLAGESVRVFSDPVEWLRRGCAGVVVLDWHTAPAQMIDVPGAACSTVELASRLDDAFRSYVPRLYVANNAQPEAMRHAV